MLAGRANPTEYDSRCPTSQSSRAWVAPACELTAWMQMLALAGQPARRWEPKRLRLRLFSLAGRLARTSRSTVLHLSKTSRWTDLLLAIITTLRKLPAPAT